MTQIDNDKLKEELVETLGLINALNHDEAVLADRAISALEGIEKYLEVIARSLAEDQLFMRNGSWEISNAIDELKETIQDSLKNREP